MTLESRCWVRSGCHGEGAIDTSAYASLSDFPTTKRWKYMVSYVNLPPGTNRGRSVIMRGNDELRGDNVLDSAWSGARYGRRLVHGKRYDLAGIA
jgi:hypothetical protein